eukprot:GHVR01184414.1.p1 GENE.GHVR01184414.1~~GHVR01184414.1.p1  ORF type:complete len:495 (-),score=108.86 GHVR01184414.1:333-1817(-)
MSYEDQLRKLGGEIDQRFFILQQRHEQQLQDILRSSQRDVELYKQRLEQEIQQRSVDINKIGDLKKEVDTINEQNKSLTKLNNTLNTTCEAQKNVIIDLKTTLNDTQKKLSDKNTSVSTIEELNTLSMKTCTAGDMTHDENNKEIIKTDEKKDENINERALEYVLQQQSSLLFYFLQENPSISTSTSILQAALQVDASVADGEDDDMSSLILSFASIEHLRKVLLNACKAGDGQLVDVCIRSVSRMFVRDVYDNDGSSLLLNSCIGGCVRTCELLLKLTTIPHTPNNQLMTPLHVACQRGDSKVVETLLSAGSDSKSVDARGRMARDIAIEYENNEILDQIDNQEVINVSSMVTTSQRVYVMVRLSQYVSLYAVAVVAMVTMRISPNYTITKLELVLGWVSGWTPLVSVISASNTTLYMKMLLVKGHSVIRVYYDGRMQRQTMHVLWSLTPLKLSGLLGGMTVIVSLAWITTRLYKCRGVHLLMRLKKHFVNWC